MSMMRFISAGKSLVGLRDSGKQYRMSDSRALPKFGSNPKKLARLETKSKPPQGVLTQAQAQAPVAKAVAPRAKAKGQGIVAKCFAKLSGMFKRKARGASAIPNLSQSPVQGELSLDNVKVLRNDLSDTDFEVVAKPAAAVKPVTGQKLIVPENPLVAPATVAEPANRAKIWNRVTTLLGAGQS